MSARFLPVLFLLAACGGPPILQGQVVDIWGTPIEGAVVIVQGQAGRPETDAQGRFTLPVIEGEHTLRVGAKGYIHTFHEFEVVAGADLPRPVIQLYPEPEETGFYVVSHGQYTALQPQKVERLGNELASIQGLRADPAVSVEVSSLEVIFHTDLKKSEILQLGLELHHLDYVHQQELTGPLGKSPVTVNMWVSQGEVDTELTQMRGRNDYRITTGPVEPGTYAFHTQGLLDPENLESFERIPSALRVAFPFTVK